MTPEAQALTVPPLVARHWFMRAQPVYYVAEDGAIMGAGGVASAARVDGLRRCVIRVACDVTPRLLSGAALEARSSAIVPAG